MRTTHRLPICRHFKIRSAQCVHKVLGAEWNVVRGCVAGTAVASDFETRVYRLKGGIVGARLGRVTERMGPFGIKKTDCGLDLVRGHFQQETNKTCQEPGRK